MRVIAIAYVAALLAPFDQAASKDTTARVLPV
jgi:hypothetical protein